MRSQGGGGLATGRRHSARQRRVLRSEPALLTHGDVRADRDTRWRHLVERRREDGDAEDQREAKWEQLAGEGGESEEGRRARHTEDATAGVLPRQPLNPQHDGGKGERASCPWFVWSSGATDVLLPSYIIIIVNSVCCSHALVCGPTSNMVVYVVGSC